MIVTETITTPDGRQLFHTKSDAGFRIIQGGTGIVYDEAVDPIDSGRTYTESTEKIEYADAPDAGGEPDSLPG